MVTRPTLKQASVPLRSIDARNSLDALHQSERERTRERQRVRERGERCASHCTRTQGDIHVRIDSHRMKGRTGRGIVTGGGKVQLGVQLRVFITTLLTRNNATKHQGLSFQ